MQIKEKRPEWLKIKLQINDSFMHVRNIVNNYRLNTVCEEAKCPNMSECWSRGTATFMILGDVCTRSCGFCAVKTGKPTWFDSDEPRRVAQAVKLMGIKHAVITSVNRDDLKDGGAGIFAETIRQIRNLVPECRVEVLIPDFKGDESALDVIIEAKPDILNHNVETVPRLYKIVRPQAKYERSLKVLSYCKKHGLITKTGMMLGIGETIDEVIEVMKDLRAIDVDILTLGQYLQPTKMHLPVDRYVTPEEFEMLKKLGIEMGFKYVESGPLVARIESAEFGGNEVMVSLYDEKSEIAREKLSLSGGVNEYVLNFKFIPKEEGLKKFTIKIQHLPGEVTYQNNQKSFYVKVLKSKYKILIISGAPSPDLAFVKRTIGENKNYEIISYTEKRSGEFIEGNFNIKDAETSDAIVFIGYPVKTSNVEITNKLKSVIVSQNK